MMSKKKASSLKSSVLKVSDLIGRLSKKAPFDRAENWDNVGLLLGNPEALVTGIVVSVNLGPEALSEASKNKYNVIVCHHPPIFKPILKLTKSSNPYAFEALIRGINVICLHTNYDLSSLDVSKKIASSLNAKYLEFAAPRGGSELLPSSVRQLKLAVYVPVDSLEVVQVAAFKAGAGIIGNYKNCSFAFNGMGTFLGGEGSNPTLGKAGVLEKAQELRVEFVVPWSLKDKVVQAVRKAHPYDEMAFDLIPMDNPSERIGYGFIADLVDKDGRAQTLPFHKVLENVKDLFQLHSAEVCGPGLLEKDLKVKKIAFSPGSGSSFITSVAAKGAQVYICGEVGYHQMLEARQKELTLVLIGHSYSERFFVETLTSWCSEECSAVKMVFETIHLTR